MNPREKNLLVLAGVLVGIGVLAFAGYKWFITPLNQYNASIRTLEDDNDELERKVQAFADGLKRMEAGRLRSLTGTPNNASSDYGTYLQNLLEKSDLKVIEIKPGTTQKVKVANAANTPGIKETNHWLVAFTVRAKGELAQIVGVLDKLQRTAVEHRIRSVTVDRLDTNIGKAAGKTLGVVIVVEALVVAQTKTPNGTVPHYDQGSSERNYADMGRRNPFMGQEVKIITKDAPKIPFTKPPISEPDTTPPEDVPTYVRLTQTVPDQNEAYLRNLIYRTREIKLIAKPQSGYEQFVIQDEFKRHTFMTAKVLRVEHRDVYFQVKDQVFKLHIGQSLRDALDHGELKNYSTLDLEDLGLFDRAFAKEQIEHEKNGKTNTQKKKGGKGGRE